ncbi:MAG TPA: hypothetical protein PKL77_09110, partial [Candidatus Omnitrophota bacterium]|nr:hypothetical protein [Candidatus Omnitrophota bacterium]
RVAVNHQVRGSSPRGGAKIGPAKFAGPFYFGDTSMEKRDFKGEIVPRKVLLTYEERGVSEMLAFLC